MTSSIHCHGHVKDQLIMGEKEHESSQASTREFVLSFHSHSVLLKEVTASFQSYCNMSEDWDKISKDIIELQYPTSLNMRQLDASSLQLLLESMHSVIFPPDFGFSKKDRDVQVGLHLVVPTMLRVLDKDILLAEISRFRNIYFVRSIRSSASALCLAGFSTGFIHSAPNKLLSTEGEHGYCEWEKDTDGNRQRLEVLSSYGGSMPVVVVEVNNESVNVSVVEVECPDHDNDEELSRDECLIVRSLSSSTCRNFGLKHADIQFTAAQLAEALNNEPNFKSSSYIEVEETSGTSFPYIPQHLFEFDFPGAFMRQVLSHLTNEVTRPFLNRTLSLLPHESAWGEEGSGFHLRRLLLFRFMELEKLWKTNRTDNSGIGLELNSMEINALVDIEQRLHTYDCKEQSQSTSFCPSSPSARLPASIAEQLTWSPARDITPPRKRNLLKNRSSASRRSSTGNISKLEVPSSARSLSGTAMRNSAMTSPYNEFSPSSYALLGSNRISEIKKIYLNPFDQHFRKRSNRKNKANRAKESVLQSVIDGCMKNALDRANVHVIGNGLGLSSPKRQKFNKGSHDNTADMCKGWKCSFSHDNLHSSPKIILLHIESSCEQNNDGGVYVPGMNSFLYNSLHKHAASLYSRGIEQFYSQDPNIRLANIYQNEAMQNIVLCQMRNSSILLGGYSPPSVGSTSLFHRIARVFEAPLNIGIRIVPKTQDEQRVEEELKSDSSACKQPKEGRITQGGRDLFLSNVLWVSGSPPPGCLNTQTPAKLSHPSHDFMEEDPDDFYESHIEKFPPSCSLFFSEDEDDEGSEELETEDSCWRDRDSASDSAPDTLTVDENSNTIDSSTLLGIGTRSVFSGGYSEDISLALQFNRDTFRKDETDVSSETFRRSRADSILTDASITPSVWTAVESLVDVPSDVKIARFGSEESYGSLCIDEERSSMGSTMQSTHQQTARHTLVEPQLKSTGQDSHVDERVACYCDASQWRVEVLQYLDSRDPLLHFSAEDVSVLYSLDLPSPQEKTPSCSDMLCYCININADSRSGLLHCSIMEKTVEEARHSSLMYNSTLSSERSIVAKICHMINDRYICKAGLCVACGVLIAMLSSLFAPFSLSKVNDY